MRTNVAVSSAGGFLLGAVVVWWFSPVPGSFWGNTFFEVPYSIATVAVPVAAAMSAAMASWLILRRQKWRHRLLFLRGLAIGVVAYGFYAATHVLAYVAFSLLRGVEPAAALEGSLWFALAFVFFGGITFMPFCCAMAVLCEWLANRVAA